MYLIETKALFLASTITVFFISLPIQAKTVDLRKSSTPDKTQYKIGFCARESSNPSGLPGHAFVMFQTAPPSGNGSFVSIGLSPMGTKNEVKAITLTTVDGYLHEEKMSVGQCLFVAVSKEQYEQAFNITAIPLLTALGLYSTKYGVLAEYRLLANDCVSFAQRIANALAPHGLKVPSRVAYPTPMGFIEEMIASN
jgi:hypothetical protein